MDYVYWFNCFVTLPRGDVEAIKIGCTSRNPCKRAINYCRQYRLRYVNYTLFFHDTKEPRHVENNCGIILQRLNLQQIGPAAQYADWRNRYPYSHANELYALGDLNYFDVNTELQDQVR